MLRNGGETMKAETETAAYFDEHAADEDDPAMVRRELGFLLGFLGQTSTPDSTLLEIGCGQGTVLEILHAHTPIRALWGCDISQRSLDRTRARVDCRVLHGSILDKDFVAGVSTRFDYVLLRAVLHHLVGRTRRESMGFVRQALQNAVGLLKPGGHLLVCEPVYGPSATMDLLFYIKRAVTCFTSRRVTILGHHDHNLGAPLVSYLTRAQLARVLSSIENATLQAHQVIERRLRRVMRLGGVTESGIVSAVVAYEAEAAAGRVGGLT
jgi:SAM-dependent methyltransferase